MEKHLKNACTVLASSNKAPQLVVELSSDSTALMKCILRKGQAKQTLSVLLWHYKTSQSASDLPGSRYSHPKYTFSSFFSVKQTISFCVDVAFYQGYVIDFW